MLTIIIFIDRLHPSIRTPDSIAYLVVSLARGAYDVPLERFELSIAEDNLVASQFDNSRPCFGFPDPTLAVAHYRDSPPHAVPLSRPL